MPGFWDYFRQFSSGMNEKHNALWQRTQAMADMRQKDMQFQHGLMSDYLKNQIQLSEIGANLGVEQAKDIRERDLGRLKADTEITTTGMTADASKEAAETYAGATIEGARISAKSATIGELFEMAKSTDPLIKRAAIEELQKYGYFKDVSPAPTPTPKKTPQELYPGIIPEPGSIQPQPRPFIDVFGDWFNKDSKNDPLRFPKRKP